MVYTCRGVKNDMPIEKEIITTENIIIDCKKQFWKVARNSFIIAPITLLLSVWLISNLITTDKLEHKIIIWIVLPISLLLSYIFIGVFISGLKKYLVVVQKKFVIKKDKLVHKIDEVKSPPGKTMNKNTRPCSLEFSKYGKFNIFDGTNYHSSKKFKMWYDELFRSSKIDDEFYLVMDDRKNILIVYNTKFFELQKQ